MFVPVTPYILSDFLWWLLKHGRKLLKLKEIANANLNPKVG
jgi:hypothetical protein